MGIPVRKRHRPVLLEALSPGWKGQSGKDVFVKPAVFRGQRIARSFKKGGQIFTRVVPYKTRQIVETGLAGAKIVMFSPLTMNAGQDFRHVQQVILLNVQFVRQGRMADGKIVKKQV